MLMRAPELSISRRGLFAGALAAAACFSPALAAPTSPWLSYEARLRARLSDAGGGAFDAGFANDLLGQANRLRRSQGLAAFQWDDGLATCARAHAADMASRHFFDHNTPEGFTPSDRASLLIRDSCGLITENLAWRDYPAGSNPGDFETLWENSPGHRKNLLLPEANRAGYGVVRVGSAYYAAGVYAEAAIKLSQAVPLRLEADASLASALAGASPQIQRLALTRPGEEPARLAPLLSRPPTLQPGLWQLRPMQAVGGDLYNVLTGPVVLVA